MDFLRSPGRSVPGATLGLLVLLLGAYAAEEVLEARTDPVTMIALGAGSPRLIADGQVERLLSNHLWHSGPIHFLVNLLVLVVFGARVERRLGALATLGLWCAGAIAGSAAWAFFGRGWLAIGASAAGFALAGAWLVLGSGLDPRPARPGARPEELLETPSSPSRSRAVRLGPLLVVAGLFLVPVILFPRAGHLSHLGGLLAGGLGALWHRFRRPPADLVRSLGGLAAVALLVVLVGGLGTALAPGRAVAAGARFLDQPGLPPPLVLAVAGSLAAREAATPAQLETVRRALVPALAAAEGSAEGSQGDSESDPELEAALSETLALVERRLGRAPTS